MLSRRVFLKNGEFTLVSMGFAPSFLARTAYAQGARTRDKQLIAIFQRGAVDGLSVVVPFGDADYYRARPSIAIQRPGSGNDAAVDLDGFFGFNPRLAPLKPFWDQHALAIVHACGSPDATRSHFDAQDYMETATAGREEHVGRLAQPLSAGATTGTSNAVSRGLVHSATSSNASGTAPATAMSQLAVRHSRRTEAPRRARRSNRCTPKREIAFSATRDARHSTPSRC